MVKPRRRSSGDPSRLNRAALRRSSLRFGRNTPGIPPSRALSAGRLAPTGRTGQPRRSPGFHHRLLGVPGPARTGGPFPGPRPRTGARGPEPRPPRPGPSRARPEPARKNADLRRSRQRSVRRAPTSPARTGSTSAGDSGPGGGRLPESTPSRGATTCYRWKTSCATSVGFPPLRRTDRARWYRIPWRRPDGRCDAVQ